MRWAFGFFTLCLVLAIVRAALITLAIAMVLALLFYFATRPRETLLFMGVLTVTGLAGAQPVAFITAAGIICITVVIFGHRRRKADESPSQAQPARPLIELEPRSKA